MSSPVTLSDAVGSAIDYKLANVNTALPAQIVSYDYVKRMASVQPVLNKVYTDGTIQQMPIVSNVPVVFPGNNVFNFTFPVLVGDYCLLVCSQRSLDDWIYQGGIVSPTDPRKFSLSDAIAIPGLMPFSTSSAADNNTDFILAFKGTEIRINSNGDLNIQSSANLNLSSAQSITIKTGTTVAIGTNTNELLDIISQLMQALQATIVMGPAFNGPLNIAFTNQVAILQSKINTIKGTIT